MAPAPIYTSSRNKLKAELYGLLSALLDAGPLTSLGDSGDPAEEEGLEDSEIVELVEAYKIQRDQQLQLYRRVFPALETDLVTLAKENQQTRGVFGFGDSDLTSEKNEGLGLSLFSTETIHRFCKLLGWTTKLERLTCPDCSGPYFETVWLPPSGDSDGPL